MELDPGATVDQPSVHVVSGRAVMVVMVEVVLATAMLSVLAMCLPVSEAELALHKEDMLRFMGETFVAPWFAKVVGFVFALLLLSAVNTAIGGMVALLYVMARDRELPETFLFLNRFGVPWVALIAATILPVIVLDISESVENLASLYAIGVVGAIVLDIGSCAFARDLPLTPRQRVIMKSTVLLLSVIWVTIALSKLQALLFVVVVLVIGFAVREFGRKKAAPAAALPAEPAATPATAPAAASPAPLLSQIILVAARGWTPGLQFALEEARLRGGNLLVLYIREVAVSIDMTGKWKDDREARALFTRLDTEASDLKVKKLYSISDSPADTIIDIAATFGVDVVVLGGSRRAALVNLLKGNVVARVAANLPESMRLIVIG
jgi:nucleotide-binding universal stress UspA family protein